MQLALAPKKGVPTKVQVMQEVFRDGAGVDADDDYYWCLLSNGTFYSFKKSGWANRTFDGDDLCSQVLQMSEDSILSDHDSGDDVRVIEYRDIWEHPTFVVLSGLGTRIGWVVIAGSNNPRWPETEDESRQVGLCARTLYELDCKESHIVATNFTWSGK